MGFQEAFTSRLAEVAPYLDVVSLEQTPEGRVHVRYERDGRPFGGHYRPRLGIMDPSALADAVASDHGRFSKSRARVASVSRMRSTPAIRAWQEWRKRTRREGLGTVSMVPAKEGEELFEEVIAFREYTAFAGTGFDLCNDIHVLSDALRFAIAIQQYRDEGDYASADAACETTLDNRMSVGKTPTSTTVACLDIY